MTGAATGAGRLAVGFVLLSGLLALAIVASLAVGARALAPGTVLQALWHPDGGRDAVIIWQLRLPRTVLGILVGASLGIAGALMQAMTRNPMAEPGLLGVNAGAALAVVLGISFLGTDGFAGNLPLALVGSLIAGGGVLALDRIAPRGRRAVHLILTGAALSASIRALTGILTLSDAAIFDSYRFWVVGSLNRQAPDGLSIFALLVLAVILPAMALGGRLNAMALGDELVRSLGLRLGATRIAVFGGTVLLCGAATAAAGPISFLGLAVPHLARRLVGPDWRWILPYSALIGPSLLLLSDIAGRIVAPPGELEAGIVTAFLGAPVLIYLVTRKRAA